MHLVLIWIFLLGSPQFIQSLAQSPPNFQKDEKDLDAIVNFKNKKVPKAILGPVKEALEYFPELEEVDITFEFKERISGAVMQAQPKVLSLFVDPLEKRKYRIKITRTLEFEDKVIPIEKIPNDALVGWIGHELGHIMDYLKRSTGNMMRFGFKYLTSKEKVVEAEYTADGYAIVCGMGHQILATKNYILNHDGFEDDYKDKIKNLYMSPDQIETLLETLDR
ncbi:hypothetical protein [Cecembia calidifontis]|jgi:hypothetical protein|uniref:Uncharacterized protein n=1 Tax=Cecembia calidifontis TaxID=1187080 RepID=A0A4Q7PEQ7_9BACT|nr:hypothetical protein [Cecembia calidifontis]RZS98775.1 hypothetical protein BC751_4447 [Cecembia calidifontis]